MNRSTHSCFFAFLLLFCSTSFGQNYVLLTVSVKQDQGLQTLVADSLIELADPGNPEQSLEELGLTSFEDYQPVSVRKERIDKEGEFPWGWEKIENNQAYLGVEIESSTEGGAKILRVLEYPALDARLRPDDVIVKVDQAEIHTSADLLNVIRSHQPGDELRISFLRNGKKKRTIATLGEHRTILRYEKVQLIPQAHLHVILEKTSAMAKRSEPTPSALVQEEAPLYLEEFQLYPNPGHGAFNLTFTLKEEGDFFIQLSNPLGQKVYEEKIAGNLGEYHRFLDLKDQIGPGIYLLTIRQNEKKRAERLVVTD